MDEVLTDLVTTINPQPQDLPIKRRRLQSTLFLYSALNLARLRYLVLSLLNNHLLSRATNEMYNLENSSIAVEVPTKANNPGLTSSPLQTHHGNTSPNLSMIFAGHPHHMVPYSSRTRSQARTSGHCHRINNDHYAIKSWHKQIISIAYNMMPETSTS